MARAKTTKKTTTKKKTTAKKTTRKPVAKKAAVRKSAAKKAPARKAAAIKAPARKITAIKSALTKSDLHTRLAEATDLTKKDIGRVFEELSHVMHSCLKKGAVQEVTLPGLMKCTVKRKPATKARKGVNPFTGEEMMFKAKPARNIVKVRPLKKLKEMAE